MNKYALSLAGGALLATTALATGTVSAATVRTAAQTSPADVAVGTTVPANVTTVNIAAELFAATSSAVAFGPRHYLIDSGARLQIQSTVSLSISGAEFDTTITPLVTLFDQSTAGTLEAPSVTTGGVGIASGAAVTMFTDRVLISNINNNTASTYGVIELSGVVFRQGQALATAGNSVTLSGTIQNAAQTTTLETIDAKAVVTSRNLLDVRVTAGTALTVSSASTPIFTTITGASTTSATLATVIASVAVATSTDLSTTLSGNSTVSTVEVKLTHAVLNDPAVVDVALETGAGFITKTPAQFQSGSVTFSPQINDLTGGGKLIRISFNGTTAISAAAAGTVAITTTAKAPALTAAVSAGGAAAALNRGGLNTTFNLVQPSTNAFASFIRIANTGGAAGTVVISVRNSATGAALGSFTSPSIAAGGSIQVSAAQIELGAGITASSSVTYDITVAGALAGFAQHIGFSAQTGGLSDLSSFRNGGAAAP